MEIIRGDRRTGRRYELELNLRYELSSPGAARRGLGRTVDMGSGGLLIWTEEPLEAGRQIRLSIDWLLPDRDGGGVELFVLGQVIRSGPGFAAVQMHTWEFRREHAELVEQRRAPRRARSAGAVGSLAMSWLN